MTAAAVDDTANYVSSVAGLLWPEQQQQTRMLALPSTSSPRMMVPIGPPRVSAAAVRGLASARSPRARMRRDLTSLALRLGVGGALVGRMGVDVAANGIGEHLSEILGTHVHVAMSVGSPRANRKPVLILLRSNGEVAGYVKVGVDALTRDLVTTEANALRRLARWNMPRFTVPTLVHAGSWRTVHIVVQSPLDTGNAGLADTVDVIPAISSLSGNERHSSAVGSMPAWVRTQRVLAELPGHRAEGLRARAEQLAAVAGNLLIEVGAWHGDFSPWNTAVRKGEVLAWDWERFAVGAPIGWDALHWFVQSAINRSKQSYVDAAHRMVSRAATLLASFGVPPTSATVIACTYLVEVGTRYLYDRQDQAGTAVGLIENWLLPALDRGLALMADRVPVTKRRGLE
jgi:hypothetical protein